MTFNIAAVPASAVKILPVLPGLEIDGVVYERPGLAFCISGRHALIIEGGGREMSALLEAFVGAAELLAAGMILTILTGDDDGSAG